MGLIPDFLHYEAFEKILCNIRKVRSNHVKQKRKSGLKRLLGKDDIILELSHPRYDLRPYGKLRNKEEIVSLLNRNEKFRFFIPIIENQLSSRDEIVFLGEWIGDHKEKL